MITINWFLLIIILILILFNQKVLLQDDNQTIYTSNQRVYTGDEPLNDNYVCTLGASYSCLRRGVCTFNETSGNNYCNCTNPDYDGIFCENRIMILQSSLTGIEIAGIVIGTILGVFLIAIFVIIVIKDYKS